MNSPGSSEYPSVLDFDVVIWCARDSGTPGDKDSSSSVFHDLLDQLSITNWSGFLVFLSSAGEVYGNARDAFTNEDSIPQPFTRYGLLKRTHEELVQRLDSPPKRGSLILRISNIYEMKLSDIGIVGAILRHFELGMPLSIEGGHQRRDFIELEDCCIAICKLIELRVRGIVNIASGSSLSILELLKAYEATFGRNAIYTIDKNFNGVLGANFSIAKMLDATEKRPLKITERIATYSLERLD
jgi:nucleoside-diphosphate-sugar epimerase